MTEPQGKQSDILPIRTKIENLWKLPPGAQDALTCCYNRSAFCEKARTLIDAHEPGYYILSSVNIDDFKVINDQYGTDIGDQILCHVAESLSECLADIGGLCTRFAADDFAVLLPACYAESPRIITAHTRACMPRCIMHRIHIRIGRCPVERDSLTITALYDRAKLAMNTVRGIYGKYIETYSELMRERLLHRRHILDSMENALKNGEFEPWLQPQYNHATGAIIGAEALVRWRKDDGYILPGDFIPIFEESGFIYDLDRYMWEQVCGLLRRWIDEGGDPLPISVNISRCDILYDDFLQTLTNLVKKYDIPLRLLRLEVTESAFSDSTRMVISKVNKLIRQGFTVEIDDFGSGFSSLNALKEVSASILKLDIRFFENTEDNCRAGNIIESVVRMAKWLDMAVIAEGVESRTQADYLKSVGCYYIQGYYYAHPMPVADYKKLVSANTAESELTRLKTIRTFENIAFWNPESMETLIFNSYIGGACIFEYRNRHIDILRVNDQFIAQFRGLISADAKERWDDLVRCTSKEEQSLFCDAAERAAGEHQEQSGEIRICSGFQTEYIRFALRVVARNDDRLLCYCAIRNLTEQRLAEQRERETHMRLQVVMNNIQGGVLAMSCRAVGHLNITFANDGFYKLCGYTRKQYDAEVASVDQLVIAEDLKVIYAAVYRSMSTNRAQTCEYRLRRRNGSILWVRMSLSCIDQLDIGENTVVGVMTDVTAEYTQKQQLIFLNESAHELLSQPDAEEGIKKILDRIFLYFGGSRAVIFEIDEEYESVHNSYERCADGVVSLMTNRQVVPFEAVRPWLDCFRRNEPVIVERVSDLTDAQAVLRDGMLQHDVRSVVAAPMLRDGRLIGFIGADNPSSMADMIFHLTALGDYAALLLHRRDLNRQINRERDLTNDIINALPGGFIHLKRLRDGSKELVYASQSMEKLCGYSHDALKELFRDGLYACVLEEDRHIVDNFIADMLRNDGIGMARYRVRRREGVCVWVNVSVRATKEMSGEVYYNIYYTT